MGYIYMADVVTRDGKRGVRVGRTSNLSDRMSAHRSDPQWNYFSPIDAWIVDNEEAAERMLLRRLKQYGRPIHGRETFCHSINPTHITRQLFGGDNTQKEVLVAPVTDGGFLIWFLIYLLFSPLLAFVIVFIGVGVVSVAMIIAMAVGWFFSNCTIPLLIAMVWVGLTAIPVTACFFIYRYGMNLAKEIAEEDSVSAKPISGFSASNPLTT